jgi:tetratricopeptide (TPR) repeat protein
LAEANLKLCNYAEALRWAEKAVAITKEQATAYLLLVQIYGCLNDKSQQIKSLESAVRILENKSSSHNHISLDVYVDVIPVYLKLAHLYYHEEKNIEQAQCCLEKVLDKDPNNIAALKGLSDCMLDKRNFVEAYNLIKRLSTLESENTLILEKFAWLAIKLRRLSEAIEIYTQLLKLQPDNIKIKKRLAALYYKKGDVVTSRRYLLETQSAV